MSQTNTETKTREGISKGYVNLFLFTASVAAVVIVFEWGKGSGRTEIAGTLMVVSACFLVLWFFLNQFRHEVLQVLRKVFFILITIILFAVITRLMADRAVDDFIYLIPFAIIPVVMRTFYDARLALIILLVTLMLCGFLVPDPFKFVLMNFVSGMAAIFTLRNIYRKTRLIFTASVVIATNIFLWTGINLLEAGRLPEESSEILFLFGINGLLVLASYPLIFLFEQNFLLLSDATLNELADTNNVLLRKFADEAPGSFQHSLQVANLAEEAARVIGANSLLVRVGSLYHDIGKIGNPRYYIENQTEGENPHQNLDPAESARLIISHVRNGVNLARNYKIPVQIIDFIRMHHGTTVAYYFFKKYIDMFPAEIDNTEAQKPFTYPGPKPFSRETAVVMMADAVEAASRTLASASEESISELVERIIYIQEQDGQFSEVPLTFKDMSDIKDVFRKRLSNIYHPRVAYPERI
jgi:putative nucleotidyltransferase with HDIG domain